MSLHVRFGEIKKSFGAVQVLHGVSFELKPGKTVGLLGENGAGKSTLMKILAGYENPSSGSLEINGEDCRFASSREAEEAGVVLIHQEFNLAEDLTVAQNIFLGRELRRGWFLDEGGMNQAAKKVLAEVGLDMDPRTLVSDLIVAEKQLVEIAKAISRKARLLVMDEPTATLTLAETQNLFQLIQRLREQKTTIVYISHKLDEVARITDDIVVMRDGLLVEQGPTQHYSCEAMANLMVGRELSDMFPQKQWAANTRPLLSVQNFSVPGWVRGVSFDVHTGEILGFAGLVGAGRTELFEGLLGLRSGGSGSVTLEGQPVSFRSPRDAVCLGITYLSEDRKGRGLHVRMPLKENLTLMSLDQHARPWLIPHSEQQALMQALENFGIRVSNPQVSAGALSGGNQQKLAMAKVLQPNPKIIILDEPTRGVDVGAKREIYFLIQQLATHGCGVVVVSSELLELIGLCHRIVVMRAGSVQATLAAKHVTEEEIIAHATGVH